MTLMLNCHFETYPWGVVGGIGDYFTVNLAVMMHDVATLRHDFLKKVCGRLTVRYEPPRGKINNVVSEQVRHKPGCTATEELLEA